MYMLFFLLTKFWRKSIKN